MKLIVTGGRGYYLTQHDIERLNAIDGVSEVVSGGFRGADETGESWADSAGLPVKRFLPDWVTYGSAAGTIRNKQMAEYADAVVLFPGGKGTANMKQEAEKARIKIYDWR